MDVALYAARSDTPQGSVPGFCLVFADKNSAEQGLGMTTAAVVEGRLPPTDVAIQRADDAWTLRVRATTPQDALDIEIPGVAEGEIVAFLKLLSRVLYYFVIFGWTNPDGTLGLVDPAGDALYKSTIVVDDRTVKGRKVDSIDWKNVFGADTHLVLGSWQ